MVSVLIAVYNEKFVISGTLDALKDLDYPKERLQVVVADDSTDETKHVVDRKIAELHHFGVACAVERHREPRQDR